MAWMQSAIRPRGEDVFDEDADEMDVARKEWKNSMQKRVQEGYTEGVEAGKRVTLQKGFNQGYQEAVKRMLFCGKLKGTIRYAAEKEYKNSVLSSWCHHRGCSSALQSEMSDLLNDVKKYEESLRKELNCAPSQPHVGGLRDIMEEMDFGHQGNGGANGSSCENATEFRGHCKNSRGTDALQSECCRRVNDDMDVTRPTFSCIKEKMANLVEQLGLSPDTIEHIHLLKA